MPTTTSYIVETSNGLTEDEKAEIAETLGHVDGGLERLLAALPPTHQTYAVLQMAKVALDALYDETDA